MTSKIRGDQKALDLVKTIQPDLATGTKTAANKVIAAAAGADGNKYLSVAEAQMAVDAFEAAKASAGTKLGKDDVARVAQTVAQEVAEKLGAENLDGLSTYFTSDKTDLEGQVVRGLQETVQAAQGRQVDIDVMIYQFQSKPIADELLALCRQNPNVHVRLIADFSQTSQSTQNQVPYLAKQAEGSSSQPAIPNLDVRYKKDDPYSWNAHLGRAAYSHTRTEGLNHHKGFVATIDGEPFKAMLGSFNWSKTANKNNYEDLIEVDATKNEAARSLAANYLEEFTAFFNNPDTLTSAQAKAYKAELFDTIEAQAKGKPTPTFAPLPPGGEAYAPITTPSGFDLNSYATRDIQGLVGAVGPKVAAKITSELSAAGRFASLEELYARVPDAAALSDAAKARLADFDLGDGKASLDVADADELMRAGFSAHDAAAIVDERKAGGSFQSLDDLKARLPHLSKTTLSRLADRLSVLDDEAFFTSKAFSDATGATGYAADHASAQISMMGTDGVVSAQAASVSNAIIDLFRRARPGETIRISMYGISPGSAEFQELMAASARGVNVKVLINEGYNDPATQAIKDLIAQGRKGLEARVQTAKTMHTKFGVLNDDVFTGSANFSTSASTVNSEDRFILRNQPEMAAQYTREFENVWARSNPV